MWSVRFDQNPYVSPFKIALFGAGRIGHVHARNIVDHPSTALTYVVDPVEDRAVELAAGARAECVGEEIALGDAAIDAIVVASLTSTHAALIENGLEAGKAVFCEKPLDLDIGRVRDVLATIDRAAPPVFLAFNRRFDPAVAEVQRRAASGAVGAIELVTVTSKDPAGGLPVDYLRVSGGMFRDMTVHDFDMARYVARSEVVEVFARGAVRVDERFERVGDVDTALVTLVHENGCLTAIDNSRQAVYGFDQRVEVFGSAGMAASENPLTHTAVLRTAEGTRTATLPHFYLERYTPSYMRGWDAFVAAVSGGRAPPVGTADARAPLVIGLAAWRSLREHRPVAVAEVEVASA